MILALIEKKLMKLMRRLMVRMNMNAIVTETYQMKTRLIGTIIILTNMIGINMIMENHHQVKRSNASLVNH